MSLIPTLMLGVLGKWNSWFAGYRSGWSVEWMFGNRGNGRIYRLPS